MISKLYFYVRIHKQAIYRYTDLTVVNWFQNCIFTWGFTRTSSIAILCIWLWIDFKIVFLREDSQGCLRIQMLMLGCELISKLYFYVRIHKVNPVVKSLTKVVNWFQNCIFTWGFTSLNLWFTSALPLWIDFKIVFLREDSQVFFFKAFSIKGCELISKLYFYVRIHKVNPDVLSKINTSGFLLKSKKHQHPKFKMIDLDGFSFLIHLKQL